MPPLGGILGVRIVLSVPVTALVTLHYLCEKIYGGHKRHRGNAYCCPSNIGDEILWQRIQRGT